MKIVCIGNSIVNGYPHKRSQCFVSLWRQATGHEIINKGVNGDVTPNVYARFESDVLAHKPAAVLILTGTNDLIYKTCTPEESMNWLIKMMGLAREHSIHVILMTPLLVDPALAREHWLSDVNYDEVNEGLRRLRTMMLEYSENNEIQVIDAQDQYSKLYTEANASEYLLDGLHPTVLGHEAISKFLPD